MNRIYQSHFIKTQSQAYSTKDILFIMQEDIGAKKYRVVEIQKLKSTPRRNRSQYGEQQILKKMVGKLERNHGQDKYSIVIPKFETFCYKDTAVKNTQDYYTQNNFLGAFLHAYNSHGNILLVPDDVWLMITLFLSKYIDTHAEKLRSQLVMHQDKKQLIIYEECSSVQQSLRMQKQWDFFFQQIIKKIKQNTVQGVVDLLKCDFSTTTPLYELISTSIIMGSLKKFFNYTRCMTCCGISKVYFDGTVEDWKKLQNKLNLLQKFDVDGVLKKYIKFVDKIISEFIRTYEGEVNVEWWNSVISPDFPMSGADTVDGWILHFFGIYKRIEFEDIPETFISVPIKLINQFTGITKNLQMITDWVSYSQIDDQTTKPDIAMAIIQKK